MLSEELIGKIVSEYTENKKTIREIATELAVSQNTVLRYLHINHVTINNNIRNRKFIQLRTDYFHNIDTVEKAYFLGLLYADGFIYYNEVKQQYRMELSLCDRDIVDKLSIILYGGNKTRERLPSKRSKQSMYRLTVASKEICQDLIQHGCIPRKSLILSPPTISKEFVRPFLRGYHDGDGCFAHHKNKNYNSLIFLWSALSTKSFCEWIKHSLEDFIQIKPSVHKFKKYTIVKVSGRPSLLKLGDWLYENKGECYISRKYQQWCSVRRRLITPYRNLWTLEEESTLRDLSETHTIEELSQILNKTSSSIETKIRRLNLKRFISKKRYWAQTEIDLLISNLDNPDYTYLTKILSRTINSIESKINRLKKSSRLVTI